MRASRSRTLVRFTRRLSADGVFFCSLSHSRQILLIDSCRLPPGWLHFSSETGTHMREYVSRESDCQLQGVAPPFDEEWEMATPVHARRVFIGEISLKGAKSMHEFLARYLHPTPGKEPGHKTKGLILNSGRRYDLGEWFADTFLFAGKLGKLRQRTVDLARRRPGETVLDVGCGTGTLAIEASRRVGTTGRVFGIDPGDEQIARARTKAAR